MPCGPFHFQISNQSVCVRACVCVLGWGLGVWFILFTSSIFIISLFIITIIVIIINISIIIIIIIIIIDNFLYLMQTA